MEIGWYLLGKVFLIKDLFAKYSIQATYGLARMMMSF